jgi:hypothetical protein
VLRARPRASNQDISLLRRGPTPWKQTLCIFGEPLLEHLVPLLTGWLPVKRSTTWHSVARAAQVFCCRQYAEKLQPFDAALWLRVVPPPPGGASGPRLACRGDDDRRLRLVEDGQWVSAGHNTGGYEVDQVVALGPEVTGRYVEALGAWTPKP